MKKQVKKKIEKEVREGQIFELKKELNYFTLGKRYEVENVYYDNGTEAMMIKFSDDDGDTHGIAEVWLERHFKLAEIQ
tara:strand:- start:836 stop:1069 length:234 start_codon:yes stop_codon:yes gene_type:complete